MKVGPTFRSGADEMKILFLTHRVPYAPNRGDRVRAYHMLRHMATFAEVEVVSLAHDQAELDQIERVREMGVRASAFLVPHLANKARALPRLGGSKPLTHLLLDAPRLRETLAAIARDRRPDVVFAYCTGVARFAMEPPLDRIPLVIDFVDVDSEKWGDMARRSRWPQRWIYSREQQHLSAFEAEVAKRAVASLVVNDREAEALRRIAPGSRVHAVPNGVQVPERPDIASAGAPSVVFCGVMNYRPNVDGVLWFVRDVWPQVRAACPTARFVIVGSDPTQAIRNLASNGHGIEVTGTVPEVTSHLARCDVSVAPLQMSRGVQNKVLEALGLGLASVVTSPVAHGLPKTVLSACVVADEPREFASAVVDLLQRTPSERRAMAARADLGSLTWERQLAPLMDVLTEAIAPDLKVGPTRGHLDVGPTLRSGGHTSM